MDTPPVFPAYLSPRIFAFALLYSSALIAPDFCSDSSLNNSSATELGAWLFVFETSSPIEDTINPVIRGEIKIESQKNAFQLLPLLSAVSAIQTPNLPKIPKIKSITERENTNVSDQQAETASATFANAVQGAR